MAVLLKVINVSVVYIAIILGFLLHQMLLKMGKRAIMIIIYLNLLYSLLRKIENKSIKL